MGERSFVGREDLLLAFDEALAGVPADEPRVLAFHGIGGIGKSRLIRRLRGDGDDPRRIPDGVVDAKIDFQEAENRLPGKALERARAQLHSQGVHFPTFDIAFAVWWKLANPNLDLKQAMPAFLDGAEVAGEIVSITEEIPGLGLIAKIPRALAKAGKVANDWWAKRGQAELAQIVALTDHSEIAGLLPRFFGGDLSAWIGERDERGAVLLFDTHEALFTERGSVVSGEAQDTWLRQWAAAMPGALVVVSGRNPVEWADEDDWAGQIDQRNVAELGSKESERFLEEADVEEADLRTALVEKSHGVPQYLELAADTYHLIRQQEDRLPVPEDFDANLDKLLKRFLSYVPGQEHDALFILSVPETFDYDLYRDLMKEFGSGMATRGSLKRLTRFTFISQPEPNRHAIHLLVRDALAAQHDPDERLEVHQCLFQRAEKHLEEVEPRKVTQAQRQALRDGVTHGLESLKPEAAVEWLFRNAAPFHQAAEWNLLRDLCEIVLLHAKSHLGFDHPSTLTSVNNLGSLLQSQGKLEEAEPLYRRGLESRERVLGEEHPDTLTSVNNLGILLRAQGKLEEAEPLYRRGLEGRERVLGGEHPSTLTSVNNLGGLLESQGKLAEAEPLYRRGLEGRERVLGEEHPDTLTSVNNLGSLLESQGKLEEAEPLFRRGLEGCERVLGADHPFTLTSVNNLGSLLQSQGKLDEAEPLYRRGLEGRERILGQGHPDTFMSLNNLGALRKEQGHLSEAEELVRRALEGAERKLGSEHFNTRTYRANLQVILDESSD